MSSCKILYINVGVGVGGTEVTDMSWVGLERVNNGLTGCHLLLLRMVISLLLSVCIWCVCTCWPVPVMLQRSAVVDLLLRNRTSWSLSDTFIH